MKPALLFFLLSLACVSAIAQQPEKRARDQPAGVVGGVRPLDDDLTPEFRNWVAANPWFGRDAERTEFARAYAKQLMQERPNLMGRPLLDAVSRRVAERFGPAK
jgi:hypothetical protein